MSAQEIIRVSCPSTCTRQTASRTPEAHNGVAVNLDRVRRFTFTTDQVDSYNTILLPSGWRGVADYVATGSVFWHHPEQNTEGGPRDMLPIGRPLRVWFEGSEGKAEIEFASADLNPWAEVVLRMVDAGYISGISPGFIIEEPPREAGGGILVYSGQRLVELSITPLRSNPGALVEREGRSLDEAAAQTLAGWMSEAIEDPAKAHGFDCQFLTRSLAVLKGEPMSAQDKATEAEVIETEAAADADPISERLDAIEARMAEIADRLAVKDSTGDEPETDNQGANEPEEDEGVAFIVE